MDEQKHIFGLGTGRCGTLTLVVQLRGIPAVLALHEGNFLSSPVILKVPNLFHGRVTNPASQQWNQYALSTRYAMACRFARWTYVEAAGYLSLNLPAIIAAGFHPRIIHLIRNPIGTITSFIRKNGDVLPVYQKAHGHPAPGAQWATWYDGFPPYPDCESGEEGLARYWNEVNSTVESDCAKFGLPRLVVLMRELGDPRTWKAILEFCGLEGSIKNPAGVMNTSKGHNQKFVDEKKIREAAEKWCTWSIPEHLTRTG